MRHLSWIITLPIAVVAVLFAVSNRMEVTLALWPLPFTLDAPVYLAALVALVVGFVAGGFIAWVGQGRNRRRARVESDRARRLEGELKQAEKRAAAAEKRVAEMTRPVSGGAPRASTTMPVPVQAEPTPPTVH